LNKYADLTKSITQLIQSANYSDESSLEEIPYSDEENKMYKRFRNSKYRGKARKTPSLDRMRKRYRYRKTRKG
jgi:hypothetical protein